MLLRVLLLRVLNVLPGALPPVLKLPPALTVKLPSEVKLSVRDTPTVDTDTSEEKSPEIQTVLSGSFVQLLNAEESNSVVVITLALPLPGALVVTGAVVMVDWLCWGVD